MISSPGRVGRRRPHADRGGTGRAQPTGGAPRGEESGAARGSRTPNLRIRSPMLYPIELALHPSEARRVLGPPGPRKVSRGRRRGDGTTARRAPPAPARSRHRGVRRVGTPPSSAGPRRRRRHDGPERSPTGRVGVRATAHATRCDATRPDAEGVRRERTRRARIAAITRREAPTVPRPTYRPTSPVAASGPCVGGRGARRRRAAGRRTRLGAPSGPRVSERAWGTEPASRHGTGLGTANGLRVGRRRLASPPDAGRRTSPAAASGAPRRRTGLASAEPGRRGSART